MPMALYGIGFHTHHCERVFHVEEPMQILGKEWLDNIFVVPFSYRLT